GESERAALVEAAAARRRSAAGPLAEPAENPLAAPEGRSDSVEAVAPVAAPDREGHVFEDLDLPGGWSYLNPDMLYVKHLGLRGSFQRLKEAGDPKLAELEAVIDRVKAKDWIRARAMYRYFDAWSEGNTLHVARPGGGAASFAFPRQAMGERLC